MRTMLPGPNETDAIKRLNAREFGGRSLTVNEARPKAVTGGGGGGFGGGKSRRRSEARW